MKEKVDYSEWQIHSRAVRQELAASESYHSEGRGNFVESATDAEPVVDSIAAVHDLLKLQLEKRIPQLGHIAIAKLCTASPWTNGRPWLF